jgi:hypothetical protein
MQQAEPVGYDKTELNRFVQDLYDEKMQEGKHGHYETMFHVVHQAIKKVAPPKQQAEPCIGKDPRCPCQDGDACHYKDCGNTKARPVPPAQPEQEPVAWMKEDWTGGHLNYACVYERAFAAFPVYKHSPAAQRKPLTEEEISNIWDDTVIATVIPFSTGFARAIEAAHGIKEQP